MKARLLRRNSLMQDINVDPLPPLALYVVWHPDFTRGITSAICYSITSALTAIGTCLVVTVCGSCSVMLLGPGLKNLCQ